MSLMKKTKNPCQTCIVKPSCTQICKEKNKIVDRLKEKVHHDNIAKFLSIGKSNKKVQRERKIALKILQKHVDEITIIQLRRSTLEGE